MAKKHNSLEDSPTVVSDKMNAEKLVQKIDALSAENKNLKKELSDCKKKIKNIEISVRDEYLHTSDWTKTALVNLVNFAAIELEPASLDVFPDKVVKFLTSDPLNYPYAGFFKYNEDLLKWENLAENGNHSVEVDGIPVFSGNMVLEEEREIYNFFSVHGENYMMCVTTVGMDKKFSRHDYSFVSLFITLMSSFFNIKMLAGEVERRMIEAAALRNFEKLLNSLKNNVLALEEIFSEIATDLSIDSFVFASKSSQENNLLRVVISKGIKVRSWDSFLKMIAENESFFKDEWVVLPVFDEQMTLYGVPAFKLSDNNPSLRYIQEKVLNKIIPQLSTILSHKKFQKESITDELTGAYNRRHILKLLEEKYKKAVIEEEENPLTVLMIDIDHFKPVNDTYGHQAGDKILREVAESITHAVREVDVVGRYGGEEFIVLLGVGKKGGANVCERIRRSIESRKFEWNGVDIWVTVSIGCVTFIDSVSTWEELVSISDMCLYEAKKSGRNKVVVYEF